MPMYFLMRDSKNEVPHVRESKEELGGVEGGGT